MAYAPYAFWFWDQSPKTLGIKPEDMAREMWEKGINPGYAHARENYASTMARDTQEVYPITQEEWLSDAWFSALERVIRQAGADGSHFSFADEFGWPSLQAGGRILAENPDMAAQTLWFRICDVAPGESVPLKEHLFATCARLVRVEAASYVEFCGGGWQKVHDSWDSSRAFEVETAPYNLAARYARGVGVQAVFHPNLPRDAVYCLYARWCDCGDNSSRVVYSVNGRTEFAVDQRDNGLAWFKLGEVALAAGTANEIVLRNEAQGAMCVDAILLAPEDQMEDAVIIDDWNTHQRQIGYIDAATLSIVSQGERQRWTAPADGPYRLYAFWPVEHRGYDGCRVNCLDARLGEKFVETAYLPYITRFAAFMGGNRAMNGVFCDTEGGFGYKLAWSGDLARHFRRKTGEDIRRMLPLLLDMDVNGQEAKARFDWYDAASDLFVENFRAPIRCAQEHGMYYTMHTWEESLPFQANMVGDYFKLNRAIPIPGADSLAYAAYNPAAFKDAASAAEFDGKRCMAEFMALLPLRAYTMEELRRQSNCLIAWGISHVIAHGVKMTRRRAQEVVTPDIFTIDPSWQNMKVWADMVRRGSFANANGVSLARVLLINPMDSIWALSDGAAMDPACPTLDTDGGIPANTASHGGKASEINRIYQQSIRKLTRARIDHLTADKYYLRQMRVEGGRLVRGRHSFEAVILPPMTVMDEEAARLLVEFARSGGHVYALGELPGGCVQRGRMDARMRDWMDQLRAAPGFRGPGALDAWIRAGVLAPRVSFLEGAFDMLCQCRDIGGRFVAWLANDEGERHTCRLRIAGVRGGAALWDPQDGSMRAIRAARHPDGGTEVELTLCPYQGLFLVIDPFDATPFPESTGMQTLATLRDGWRASLNRGNRECVLEHAFPAVQTSRLRLVLRKGPVAAPQFARIAEITLYGQGAPVGRGARVRASSGENPSFVADGDPATVWQNATPIQWGESQFLEWELGQAECIDRIRIETAPGFPLREYRLECWQDGWWHTLVTAVLHEEPELIRPVSYPAAMQEQSVPVALTDWRTWGLLDENFAGSVEYENAFELDSAKDVFLDLGAAGQSARVYVNGQLAGVRIGQPFVFALEGVARPGKNHLRVCVSNSIAANVDAQAQPCGLLGEVRLIKMRKRPTDTTNLSV